MLVRNYKLGSCRMLSHVFFPLLHHRDFIAMGGIVGRVCPTFHGKLPIAARAKPVFLSGLQSFSGTRLLLRTFCCEGRLPCQVDCDDFSPMYTEGCPRSQLTNGSSCWSV